MIRKLGWLLLLAAACADPVHDDAVAALGPEDDRVPVGPLHRPGQPCVVCHGGSGPAALVFSFGGTAYQDPKHAQKLPGAFVELTDATGQKYLTGTNCAGNFFVEQADFDPVFPVHARLRYAGVGQPMLQHIGRDGSCADCHTGSDGPRTKTHVYFSEDPLKLPPSGCP